MEYLAHLQKDPKLAAIIQEPVPPLVTRHNIHVRLMASIMSQQLSTKVAKVIYKRFLEIFGGSEPTLQQVIDTPFEILRAIGLSNAKVNYIKNVAAFCIDNNITDAKLLKIPDEEVVTLLTTIKGVGKWTVEMLLMFALGREDVFAVDDLGIQQAMAKIYNLSIDNKKVLKSEMINISNNWKPYRTYACLHLWNWKDNV